MAEFYSIVTNIGFQKINECLATGSKLDLKFIAVGDSNGSYYEPAINQTSLLNEGWRGEISEGTAKDIWLKVVLSSINPDVIELKIDPSVQTATVQYVLNLFNNHNHSDLMPIWVYDTNANGIVDSCEFVDGGIFTDNQQMEPPQPPLVPEFIMNTAIYDKDKNGIVDEAENIDAGEF